MFPTKTLLSQAVRVTLFTRANCGLCDTAKHTVTQLNQRKPFDYRELDIMKAENKPWRDVYDFDVPVLHIQPSRAAEKTDSDLELSLSEPKKLFHRFTEQEVEKVVDQVDNETR